jgi:AmiR/NasT family two-component response regulator
MMNDDGSVFDAKVHQAEGVLVSRYSVPIHEAARMLRAWAAEQGVTLRDMAVRVLATIASHSHNGHVSR